MMFLSSKTFSFSILICTLLQCYDESTTFGMSLNTKKSINTSSNKRCGRMLGAKEKNRMREQNYANLKKRIKILLDEDDNTFGERLNKLTHDDKFRKIFNKVLQDDIFQENCNRLMLDKHFRQKFSELNNNYKNQSFTRLDDSNNHVEENTDPFKYYNNLEEYFDELKSKNDNKEKIIYELKCESSYKEKQKDDMKHINHDEREPVHTVEYDMSFNLRNIQKHERHLQSYMYSGLPKRKKKSMSKLQKSLPKMESTMELKSQRPMTTKSHTNGHLHIQHEAKCESFLSCIAKEKILVPRSFVPGIICIISAVFITTFPVSLTFLPIVATITAAMSIIASNISSYALK